MERDYSRDASQRQAVLTDRFTYDLRALQRALRDLENLHSDVLHDIVRESRFSLRALIDRLQNGEL